MSLSLNVLNHLGLNLYSNVPAVLSEAVANAWDADAEHVDVDIDPDEGRIEIVGDGHGMDADDVNDRYLHVGYRRRQDEGRSNRTPKHDRPVMGRKGIGKLSLLSIAETVEVYTTDGDEEHAFRMNVDEIEAAIGDEDGTGGANATAQQYVPTPIEGHQADFERGTKLVLTDLKKRVHTTEDALRKRLARRFSILGAEYDFTVRVNGDPVDITDRDYFHKVQFLWTYGDDRYADYCREGDLQNHEHRPGQTESGYDVEGWIGTVELPGDLVEKYPGQETEADDLNKISLMVRGKMAKPDLLEDVNDSRMYTKYLVGEFHADFLDIDAEEDIATSSREDVVKEDPRYQELLAFLRDELDCVARQWDDLRNARGSDEARRVSAIDAWYESLDPDNRERAKKLFGKINQITVDDDAERRELFVNGVLAFENLKYDSNLQRLNDVSPKQSGDLARTLEDLGDVEASRYHQIVSQRLPMIREIQRKLVNGGVEPELIDRLADHPWLLDPSWERATGIDRETRAVRERLAEVEDLGTKDGDEHAPVDYSYVRAGGRHVALLLFHPEQSPATPRSHAPAFRQGARDDTRGRVTEV
jgi:hypothetical protein